MSPPFAPVPGLSRTSIDRAGETISAHLLGTHEPGPSWDEFVSAVNAMVTFRSSFQVPMNKTAMGLRSMVGSCCPEIKARGKGVPVSQRLKRQEQIARKLTRMPNTKLANMADIGGVRAVLDNRDQVDRVVERILAKWETHGRIRDTRDEAAESGYRALHVMVNRDGRRIEIQLRTPAEHEWAVAVERTGQRLGYRLKEGFGPAELKGYFRLASEGMYADSHGIALAPEFFAEWATIRRTTAHYFER